jgi:hypothetical protein
LPPSRLRLDRGKPSPVFGRSRNPMLIGRTIRQSCCRICFEELCNTWEVSPALYGPRGGLYQSTETKGLTTMRSNRDDPLCSYSNPQVADNARPYHLPPPGLGKSSVSIQIRAIWPSARPALWGSACCAGGDDAGDEAAVNADLAKPTGPEPTGFARDSPLEGAGFEPSVPRERETTFARLPATASPFGNNDLRAAKALLHDLR